MLWPTAAPCFLLWGRTGHLFCNLTWSETMSLVNMFQFQNVLLIWLHAGASCRLSNTSAPWKIYQQCFTEWESRCNWRDVKLWNNGKPCVCLTAMFQFITPPISCKDVLVSSLCLASDSTALKDNYETCTLTLIVKEALGIVSFGVWPLFHTEPRWEESALAFGETDPILFAQLIAANDYQKV